jgi:hypothetical protein
MTHEPHRDSATASRAAIGSLISYGELPDARAELGQRVTSAASCRSSAR